MEIPRPRCQHVHMRRVIVWIKCSWAPLLLIGLNVRYYYNGLLNVKKNPNFSVQLDKIVGTRPTPAPRLEPEAGFSVAFCIFARKDRTHGSGQ